MSAEQPHPAPFELEAFSVGERADDPAIVGHLEACADCRAYVDGLGAAQRTFVAGRDAQEAVRAARRAADARPAAGADRRAGWPGRLVPWLALGAIPLLVAVVALRLGLFGGGPASDGAIERGGGAVRLKGAPIALAVIRLRDGNQSRHAGARVRVAAGDRLRVELTLGAAALLSVGVLEQPPAAGAARWTALVQGQRFEAGVQHVEPSFTLDGSPASRWIVVGPPAAVTAALRQRSWSDPRLVKLRLVGVATPADAATGSPPAEVPR